MILSPGLFWTDGLLKLLKHLSRDCVIALLVTVFSFFTALTSLEQRGVHQFYEKWFAPAVVFACTGHYYRVPSDYPELKSLGEFLDRERNSLNCSDLPEDLSRFRVPMGLDQRGTLYLIGSAGLIWHWTGVSWSALEPLGALLVSLFAVSLYGLSRLFVGRLLALFVVAAATLSPMHVAMMPELRDYSKGPFLLATMFLVGAAFLSRTPRSLILISALAGAVAGAGFGFRSDLALALPFYLIGAIVLGCIDARRPMVHYAAGMGSFFIAFVAIASPIIMQTYGEGGIYGHVALLGLTTPFNEPLGLTSPYYDVGNMYMDDLIQQFVNVYYLMTGEHTHRTLRFIGPEYNKATLAAYITFCLNFPADILIRAYSAIIHTLNATLLAPLSSLFDASELAVLFDKRAIEFEPPFGVGALLAFAAVTLLARRRPRAALYLLLLVLYFAGSTAIQYAERHAFYLQFAFWLSAALLIATGIDIVRSIIRRDWRWPTTPRFGSWLIPTGAVLLMLLTLGIARKYQEHNVASLIEEYLAAPQVPLQISDRPQNGTTLLALTGSIPDVSGAIASIDDKTTPHYFYLVATLDFSNCPGEALKLTAQYSARRPWEDFSRALLVKREPGIAHVFFPASVTSDSSFNSSFTGLAVSDQQRKCVTHLDAITKGAHLPLPLWLVLPPDWRDEPRFQKLKFVSWW